MFRTAIALAIVSAASSAFADAAPDARALLPNRAPLAPAAFVKLPIGSVRADGWLLRQLELQKAGLTGSAEQLYDALTPDSGWLGGKGESWEKTPYYVKGLVALAYTLDDQALKQHAQKWIDWTLQSQRPDGMFGPQSNDDWWPRMVVLFYLRDYYEATGDKRVLPFLTNYFRYQLATLPGRPLKDWGKSRAGDNLDVVLWLYNRTADPSLLALAKLLNEQAYAWTSIFTVGDFYKFGDDFQPHHIVNVSQALKMPAVAWQFTHDDADKNAFAAGVANLDRQYGRIDGQVSGTEFLSGLNSTAGVELCADVERIISNGIAIDVLGDAALADQMEKVAYNSLPAHTSPQMRQITYYQLPNQIAATNGGHGFTQDYANGNMPGPHSGFPCCCYNWHAGWPKLVENLWAATPDGGVALVAYGPSRVTTTVNGDTPITIAEATEYPFDEKVTLKVDPSKPATFPLVVRVPGWCESPEIAVNGEAASGVKAGTFHRLAREWKPGDVVTLTFPMTVKASTWANGSVGLTRGPLAFALKIGEQWQKTTEFLKDFDEFEVRPTTAWNYALDLDRAQPTVGVKTRPVGAIPFATDAPPVTLSVQAKRVPAWGAAAAGRHGHARPRRSQLDAARRRENTARPERPAPGPRRGEGHVAENLRRRADDAGARRRDVRDRQHRPTRLRRGRAVRRRETRRQTRRRLRPRRGQLADARRQVADARRRVRRRAGEGREGGAQGASRPEGLHARGDDHAQARRRRGPAVPRRRRHAAARRLPRLLRRLLGEERDERGRRRAADQPGDVGGADGDGRVGAVRIGEVARELLPDAWEVIAGPALS